MTDSDNQRLDRIDSSLNAQGDRLNQIENTLEKLISKIDVYDSKLDAYQKASQQVVNIAFGLLATATLAIIIPAVLAR
jgi:acetolactate synthase small subunit